MDNELLVELIEKVNRIFASQSNEVINECINILDIQVSPFELDEMKYKSSHNVYLKEKEIYAEKIISSIEKRLDDEQKAFFYKNIRTALIKYTSNEELKKNVVLKCLDEGKLFHGLNNINECIISILSSISDDSFKLDFLRKYESQLDLIPLREIVCSFADDQMKMDYFPKLIDDAEELGELLLSIKDDSLKLSLFDKYRAELDEVIDYDVLLSSLHSDDMKLKELERINYNPNLGTFLRLMYSLTDEESLLSIWDKVNNNGKLIIIYKIKDIAKRFELFKRLNNDLVNSDDVMGLRSIGSLIGELPVDYIKYIVYECPNISLGYRDLAVIVNRLDNETDVLEILKKRGDVRFAHHIRKNHLLSPEIMLQNLDLFLTLDDITDDSNIKKYVEYLYQTNNDIVYTINWDLLKPKYIDTLGLDKINVIGSFNELTNSLLKMNDKEYEAFYRVLDYYIQKEGSVTWQNVAYQMMQEIHFNHIDGKELCGYIDNFDNVNWDNLLYILLNGDNFGVKSFNDINNYDRLLQDKCNKKINDGSLDEMKDAIFIKFFGLSDTNNLLRGFRGQIKNGMMRMYDLYAKDISLIEDESLKELFALVGKVINSESEEELKAIYNSRHEFGHLDTYKLERVLKNEFLKLYNQELLQLDGLEKTPDGLYDAGVNFSMIVTSVGAYIKNNPDDYKRDWNRPSLASGHFCASYIRNDMLGTAPVPHFMYGFANMEPYSLLLSGSTDIYSSGASFISKAYNEEEYLGPDSQINQTAYNTKYRYNEMDFSRIQNGKKKVPDYIVVLCRNGVIDNLDDAKKAQADWDGLPIVVIDVDKCLKHEKELLAAMLNEYYNNPTAELYNAIRTKIMNNRMTDSTFAEEVNLIELEETSEVMKSNGKSNG